MLTSSRAIIQRLLADGWVLKRVRGSHHIFSLAANNNRIVVPHPKKDLATGLVRQIYKIAGWPFD